MADEVSDNPENRKIVGYRETFEGKTADGAVFTLRVASGTEENFDTPLRDRQPILIGWELRSEAGKLLDLNKIISLESGRYFRVSDNICSEYPFELLPDGIKTAMSL